MGLARRRVVGISGHTEAKVLKQVLINKLSKGHTVLAFRKEYFLDREAKSFA